MWVIISRFFGFLFDRINQHFGNLTGMHLGEKDLKCYNTLYTAIQKTMDYEASIEKFFGLGKKYATQHDEDVDTLIGQAVIENDQS